MRIYIIIIVLILFQNCDKSKSEIKTDYKNTIISKGSNNDIVSYYEQHTKKYDIGIHLQSTNNGSFKNYGNSYNGSRQLMISASFGTDKISLDNIKQLHFKIGEYYLDYDSKYEFNRTTYIGDGQDNNITNVFSLKNIPVDIPILTVSNRITNFEIENPNPIHFTYPIGNFQEIISTHNNQLLIKWNKDIENKNGIIIMLSWNGETVSRTKLFPNNDLKIIKAVEDDGEELIDDAMLQYFPDDALIDIAIGRGNIETSNNNGYSTIVESLTYAYERFGVKK